MFFIRNIGYLYELKQSYPFSVFFLYEIVSYQLENKIPWMSITIRVSLQNITRLGRVLFLINTDCLGRIVVVFFAVINFYT